MSSRCRDVLPMVVVVAVVAGAVTGCEREMRRFDTPPKATDRTGPQVSVRAGPAASAPGGPDSPERSLRFTPG